MKPRYSTPYIVSPVAVALYLFAGTHLSAETTTIFAPGVTATSGWYDVNKKSTGGVSTKDFNHCWAAASSNLIQYWQDSYKAAGNKLPSGALDGTNSKYGYELEVFDTFLDNWTPEGADPYVGLSWYFHGQSHSISGYSVATSGTGGYWKDEYEDLKATFGGEFIQTEVGGYSTWGPWGDSSRKCLDIFSERMKELLSRGAAGLVIKPGLLHSVTLWGAEFDALGIVCAVYLTDSDDAQKKAGMSLRRYEVTSENYNRKILLPETDYGSVEVTALYGLSAYPIPEPSAFGLLAGTLALAFVASRRRRKA